MGACMSNQAQHSVYQRNIVNATKSRVKPNTMSNDNQRKSVKNDLNHLDKSQVINPLKDNSYNKNDNPYLFDNNKL